MVLFAVQVLTCELESATKMVFLIGWLKTQVTSQHRLLQVNYVFSTKTDLGSVTIKLNRAVTYDEDNSPVMTRDPLNTWSLEVR